MRHKYWAGVRHKMIKGRRIAVERHRIHRATRVIRYGARWKTMAPHLKADRMRRLNVEAWNGGGGKVKVI